MYKAENKNYLLYYFFLFRCNGKNNSEKMSRWFW